MTEKNKIAVCVVGDTKFLFKYLASFINSIRTTGKYSGDIIVITNYFFPSLFFKLLFVKNNKNIIFLKFPRIKFSKNADKIYKNLDTRGQPNRYVTKNFQWHKIHVFDRKLKNWDFIFYIDINMKIHSDINNIFKILPRNKLFARSDNYPNNENSLSSQFDDTSKIYKELLSSFDLTINNYFQTGILFFDTTLIKINTKKEIINLANKFPISLTNEQGIMNLYFKFIYDYHDELPYDIDGKISYFYWKITGKDIIITKQNVEQYK